MSCFGPSLSKTFVNENYNLEGMPRKCALERHSSCGGNVNNFQEIDENNRMEIVYQRL